jgi:hypothetical protein
MDMHILAGKKPIVYLAFLFSDVQTTNFLSPTACYAGNC